MCSTPKPSKQTPRKVYANPAFDAQTMARFTAVANAAEERRERKRQQQLADTQNNVISSLDDHSQDTKMATRLKKWLAIPFMDISLFHK